MYKVKNFAVISACKDGNTNQIGSYFGHRLTGFSPVEWGPLFRKAIALEFCTSRQDRAVFYETRSPHAEKVKKLSTPCCLSTAAVVLASPGQPGSLHQ